MHIRVAYTLYHACIFYDVIDEQNSESKQFGDDIKFKQTNSDTFLDDYTWLDSDEETFDSAAEFSMKYSDDLQSAQATGNSRSARQTKKSKVWLCE